ncbi:Hypp5355 [Branchiostoma lanceolatum]|uniref:Hypp5355 protein n=1 Tax=Branchiostoma lanceolatum TaxID=7740 RepID=A0A8K0AGY9_BRALA|nr:Hypp5355 [Branchiostoma lanceolatum]
MTGRQLISKQIPGGRGPPGTLGPPLRLHAANLYIRTDTDSYLIVHSDPTGTVDKNKQISNSDAVAASSRAQPHCTLTSADRRQARK